ncbi:MAG: 16S rRNA (guanine(966)-N(2))-methyltransferase RsmD [Balneolales bacterium]|nr:16S rRNA (guanine(966)-N(2))-methyltransferase RsmD [Balneolales bacterium]
MRIITGTLKGRKFDVPKDVHVRPTSDRAKEGLFNVIEARKYIRATKVLDLFGGSGNLSFESISRGASHVTIVETSNEACKHIEKTARKFGIENQINVINMPVERFINGNGNFYDFIFADPPYDWPEIPEMIERLLTGNWLNPEGWLIVEHDVRHLFHEHPHCVFTKPYGRTIVSIFLKELSSSESEEDTNGVDNKDEEV